MSNLVVRGMATPGTMVTGGLGPAAGVIVQKAIAGAVQLAGTLATVFIPADVSGGATSPNGRRFFGTMFGPKGKGHS